ncbi:hypothetical protein GOP47_0001125 [Adiantum capillus-veneris]|uniref:Pentatricopeptide repeat-containing protein n=1 Tax=Adiantum capillus-veneris TaxID=13818 RepID=A0A9D4ZSX4_ADICA|nr:hypothetical protein GOP47_0001125 [Adiantum capillus-veneris]
MDLAMLRSKENSSKHMDTCAIQEAVKWVWETSSLEETLGSLEDMPILPSLECMVLLMQKCTKEKNLIFAKRVFVLIHKHGGIDNVTLGNHLVQMLVACKGLSHAQEVFETLPCRKEYAWASLIQGYSDNGYPVQTLELFDRMQGECVRSAIYIYPAVFKACARLKYLEKGQETHSESVAKGIELDLYVGNSLVDMYAKCGSLLEAQEVLKKQRLKNAISWNALITAFADLGLHEEVWACLEMMELEGQQPDAGTFVCILKACRSKNSVLKGRQLHILIVKGGWDRSLFIANSLVDMYAKCGQLEEAQKALDHLTSPNLVSWTALISGYVEHGLAMEALNAYKRMQREGLFPDDITFVCCLKACSATGALHVGQELHLEVVKTGLEHEYLVGSILVDMYAKCGLVEDAQNAFDKLYLRTVVSWTALIAGYAKHGHNDVASRLFQKMQEESVIPNTATYTCILRAYGNLGAIDRGHCIHARFAGDQDFMLEFVSSFPCPEPNGIDCSPHASQEKLTGALIDMYSRCGCIVDAKKVFDTIPVTNLVTCNTLIMGCSRQGESSLVPHLMQRMKEWGIVPNGVTFVGLLTACSHSGWLEVAYKYYEDLVEVYLMDLTVEHCNCMIDLYSRAGQHDEALAILENMPFQPDLISFGSMFSVCRSGDLVELGRQVLDGASFSGKNLASVLISMSNIYATAHMWEDVEIIKEILQASKDS